MKKCTKSSTKEVLKPRWDATTRILDAIRGRRLESAIKILRTCAIRAPCRAASAEAVGATGATSDPQLVNKLNRLNTTIDYTMYNTLLALLLSLFPKHQIYVKSDEERLRADD